jgi:CubicO group peptidase (beta-lactamase class C family)
MIAGGSLGGRAPAAGNSAATPNVPDIDRCVQTGVYDKTFSAAACIASAGGRIFHRAAYGQPAQQPPVRKAGLDLLFDLGSLTRPLATALAALWLTSKGRLDLNASLTSTLPELKDTRFEKVTIDMLLDHSSGLPASPPSWQELSAIDAKRPEAARLTGSSRSTGELKETLKRLQFAHEPGTCVLESDLGFVVLGWIVESAAGQPLDALLEREVYRPLGIADDLFFVRQSLPKPQQRWARRTFAAGEQCAWRKRLLQGEVSDPVAWSLGGVAGHAGLFGTVDAVWELVHALWAGYTGRHCFFLGGTVKRFWTRSRRVSASSRALGWDTTTVNGSPAGKRFSQGSVGHVGSTGGAVWIDPATDVIGVFLANAQHPSLVGKSEALAKLHPRLFELIAKYGEALAPESQPRGSRAFYDGPIQGSQPAAYNRLRGPRR